MAMRACRVMQWAAALAVVLAVAVGEQAEPDDGLVAVLAACSATDPGQLWHLRDGKWGVPNTLFNRNISADSKCLEIGDYSTDNGAAAREWHCCCEDKAECPVHCSKSDDPCNQHWTYQGGQLINGCGASSCLEAAAAVAGAPVYRWECGHESNATAAALQRWQYSASASAIQLTSDTSLCVSLSSHPAPPPPPGPGPAPPSPPAAPCSGALAALPFCNWNLTAAARAKDLVSRFTTAEKVPQMSTNSFTSIDKGHTPGVPRLGVPAYNYHTEGLHGVRDSCDSPATLYPQVTAMAATGNLSLIEEMARVMGRQFRAANNVQTAAGTLKSKGCTLSVYGPTLNIIRDPRWGRGQESVSESPYLNALYGKAFVAGVQGDGDGIPYLQVATTCKHLVAYNQEADRMTTSHATVSKQDLFETYIPAFRACVEANVQQIMCSYNLLNIVDSYANGSTSALPRGLGADPTNNIGACYHNYVQNDLIRSAFGFNGSIVSDCDAIKIHANVYPSDEDAVGAGVRGGCDQDCGGFYSEHGALAVQEGKLAIADLDTALQRIFEMRFKLGEFDPQDRIPYTKIPPHSSDDPFSRDSALRAAQEAVALLRNAEGVLPLKNASGLKVAVIGPAGNNTSIMYGAKPDYSPAFVVTVVEGIQQYASATFEPGCSLMKCGGQQDYSKAVALAKASDHVIMALGVGPTMEGEGHDRTNIDLPPGQTALLQAVVNAVGKEKVVVVFVNGGSVSADWTNANMPTIVDAFEGGQSAGTGLADVLFGTVAPSGMMPYTVYPSNYTEQVAMDNYEMRPNNITKSPGRTFRFYTGQPQWPFGWGLSYTTFAFAWDKAAPSELPISALSARGSSPVRVRVSNTGGRDAQKIVLLFVAPLDVEGAPRRTLIGVRKTMIEAGGAAVVSFDDVAVAAPGQCAFCTVDRLGRTAVLPGRYRVLVGNGRDTHLDSVVRLTGPARLVEAL